VKYILGLRYRYIILIFILIELAAVVTYIEYFVHMHNVCGLDQCAEFPQTAHTLHPLYYFIPAITLAIAGVVWLGVVAIQRWKYLSKKGTGK
jgi:hypothetical protein